MMGRLSCSWSEYEDIRGGGPAGLGSEKRPYDIAREIAERLRMRLATDQRKRLAKRSTSSAEAYQAYLKGRYEANQWTASGYHRAIEHFKHALRMDPDFALAYAGLSDLYACIGFPPLPSTPRG
jgi:tetratricopeptide (TPR) repeat protein